MKRFIFAVFLLLLPFQCFANWFAAASGGITIPDIKAQDNFRQGLGFTLQTGRFILNKQAFLTLSWDYLIPEFYTIVNSQSEKYEITTEAKFSNITLNFNYFVFEGIYANIGIGESTMKYQPKTGQVGDIFYQIDYPTTEKIIFIIGVGYLQQVYDILSLKLDIYQNTDFNGWSDRNSLNLRAGLLIDL